MSICGIHGAATGRLDCGPYRTKAALVAAWLATAPAAGNPATTMPGLHVPAARVLPVGGQRLQLQATLEENYPHFQLAHSQGIAGRFETRLNGLFRHAKVTGLGGEYRYDSDQLEAGLRWQISASRKTGFSLIPSAGYSRISERHRYSDGRRASATTGYYWAEISAVAPFTGGLELGACARGLREIGPDTETTVAVFSVELPPVSNMTLLGDMGFFDDNPGEWRKPWAAGIRMRHEKHNLYFYLSNTWGTTMPASLAGTDLLFYNLRVVLGI